MKFNILEKLKEIFLKKSEYKTEKTAAWGQYQRYKYY